MIETALLTTIHPMMEPPAGGYYPPPCPARSALEVATIGANCTLQVPLKRRVVARARS